MRQFVRSFLSETGSIENDADLVVLALDEACTNIIRHAYNHEEIHPIRLECEKRPGSICFRLFDCGTPCKPEDLKGRPIDQLRPGGLGLHFIRSAFDKVDYAVSETGTQLILEKMIQ